MEMATSNLKQLLTVAFSTIGAIIFIIAALDALDMIKNEPNECLMTYMSPQYLKVPFESQTNANNTKKYELFLYRERLRKDIPAAIIENELSRLKGVPALFIPGNAGSHKQVRSIASESSRMFHNITLYQDYDDHVANSKISYPNNIDYFAVNFHDELSALSGETMRHQTQFVNECIDYILQKYAQSNAAQKPSHVLIIGHSMGGLIARALFLEYNYPKGSVNTILTLNSPHSGPPLLLDRGVAEFYEETNRFWSNQFKSDHNALSDVSIVSIAGGVKDILVRSDLVSIEGIVPPTQGFSVSSTSLPSVWVSADHQCIMWCHQVVRLLSNTLLQLVDKTSRQVTGSVLHRMEIFKRNLLSPFPQYFGFNDIESIPSLKPGPTQEALRSILTSQRSILNITIQHSSIHKIKNKVISVPLSNWVKSENSQFLMMSNLKAQKLYQAFLAGNIRSNKSEILEITSLAKNIYVDQQKGSNQINSLMLVDLKKDLLVDASTMEDPTIFFLFQENVVNNNTVTVFDFHSPENAIEVSSSNLMSGYKLVTANTSFVNLTLKDQDKHWPLRLTLSASQENFSPTIYQYTQSMAEDIVRKSNDTLLSFHQLPSNKAEDIHLLLFLDPSSKYDITITLDVMATLSQFVKAYPSVITTIAYMIVFWLLSGLQPSESMTESFIKHVLVLLFMAPLVYVLTWCTQYLEVAFLLSSLPSLLASHSFSLFYDQLATPFAMVVCYYFGVAVLYWSLVGISLIFRTLSWVLRAKFFGSVYWHVALAGFLVGTLSHGLLASVGALVLCCINIKDNNFNTRQAIFTLVVFASILQGPSFIIYFKSLEFLEYQQWINWTLRGDKLFGFLNLVTALTVQQPRIPRNFGTLMLLYCVIYCMFPLYRLSYVIVVQQLWMIFQNMRLHLATTKPKEQ